MRTITIAVLAAAALAVGVMGAARAVTWAPATSAPRLAVVAGGQRLPVAYDGVTGWGHGQVRPGIIYLDGSNVFARIPRWSRWSGASAASSGTLWVDTCSPTCSAGHYHRYAADLTLSRVAVHRGARYFSRLHLRYRHDQQRSYGYRWATYSGATVPVWIGGPG